jgi:hypothetical protein
MKTGADAREMPLRSRTNNICAAVRRFTASDQPVRHLGIDIADGFL